MIGVGQVALTIGTDDTDIVRFLESWRIDEPSNLVDFGLLLHPAPPADRSAPRVLPSLKHGSDVIARSDDTALLCDALLRMITAATEPAPPRMLRVQGAVLEHEGRAFVVPEGNARTLSLRALAQRGVRYWPGQTVLIDPRTQHVVLDPPFGSGVPALRLPLAQLWFNHREPTLSTTLGEDVARLLGHCIQPPAHRAVAAAVVDLAEELVERMRPSYVAFGRQALEKELTALFGR